MFTFLVIVTFLVVALLILVTAMRPARQTLQADLLSAQRIVSNILLVASVLLLLVAFGWVLGALLTVALVLFYGVLSRLTWVARQASRAYGAIEPGLKKTIKKYPAVWRVFRVVTPASLRFHVQTRAELTQLIKDAAVLTEEEKDLLQHGLVFDETEVKAIMTPKKSIVTVKDDEFLGPLVLDELHGLGHSRLVVIHDTIENIVGVVNIEDLLSLHTKHSQTAVEAMDHDVPRIARDANLPHALSVLLASRHHLGIVVNDAGETVGLVTLGDVLKALTGRAISKNA